MEDKRIINGTYGEVWLNDEKVGECYGLQAKINFQKEDIRMCGKPGVGKKVIGYNGTGSLKMHKINSRMGRLLRSMVA
ncbi:MAG TPA: phage tail tube protein, partial [Bacillota bacterium]|nr:phage tail tube protein [Bacillota bacterium]